MQRISTGITDCETDGESTNTEGAAYDALGPSRWTAEMVIQEQCPHLTRETR
jgi:hypothetical protein